MSQALIRAQIVAVLQSVPDIGVVHSYERYAKDLSQLVAHYGYTPGSDPTQLRGWFVTRLSVQEITKVQPRVVEITRWIVRGFMGLNDAAATELAFHDLVEAVRDAFRGNETLNDTVSQCAIPVPNQGYGEAGIQMLDAGPVLFGGVLCHSARLALNTVRYL